MKRDFMIGRRAFLGSGAALAAFSGLRPAWAAAASHGVSTKDRATLSGEDIRLTVDQLAFPVDGRIGTETTAAIRAFEQDQGLVPRGRVSAEILTRLQKGATRLKSAGLR